MSSTSPRCSPAAMSSTASWKRAACRRSSTSRSTALKASVSTVSANSKTRTLMGGGSPRDLAIRPHLWSNSAMPGNITPSLGSTAKARSACWRTESVTSSAAAVAPMAAATSAVLLAIPFFRGIWPSRLSRASRPVRPKRSERQSDGAARFGRIGRTVDPPRSFGEGHRRCRVEVDGAGRHDQRSIQETLGELTAGAGRRGDAQRRYVTSKAGRLSVAAADHGLNPVTR